MDYPSSLSVFGHDVSVKVFSDPIEVVEGGQKTDVVLAQYDPQTTTISLMHVPDKPGIGGSNFVHEVIEAIDVYDLFHDGACRQVLCQIHPCGLCVPADELCVTFRDTEGQ